MKLAANLLRASFLQTLAESLLLVDAPAAEAAQAIDVLADSNIGAAILRARAPRIVAALKRGHFRARSNSTSTRSGAKDRGRRRTAARDRETLTTLHPACIESEFF
jgi:3-hydroxyisobutyrate dehydrogenase-like beta-hydroxyacid dehydrogenase